MIAKENFMNIWSLYKQGLSQRTIARKLGISRHTVSKYLKTGELPHYKQVKRHSKLKPFYQMIHDWLKQDNYSATKIHELVVAQGFSGSYDVTQRYVREIKEEQNRLAYVRFETLPGYQAQVDFSDFQVVNPDGSVETLYCFSMVLGFSRHMYVELVPNCQMPTFLDCHMRAFQYFGGVPCEIVYDNLKQVVLKHVVGKESKFNQTFMDFACHYRFKVVACPPYSPWVKGKCEKPFDFLRERFWRGYSYRDLASANQNLHEWLNTVAAQRVHGTTKQVVSERFEQEKPHLGDLPRRAYDTSQKEVRKVFKDCQISFRNNRYVVPHHYVGKKVLVKYKDGQVNIFCDDLLLADYQEPKDKGRTLADPRFYEALKADQEQNKRKYGHDVRKKKGRAIREIAASPNLLFTVVSHRPLGDYDKLVGGASCLH